MDQRDARNLTADAYYRGYNTASVPGVLACYADTAVLEEVGSGRSHQGLAALELGLERFLGLFGDLRFETGARIAAGDSLLCPYRMTAVVQRDLGPMRLAGRRITLNGAHLLEFEGDRIGRCRDFWDFDELAAQAAKD